MPKRPSISKQFHDKMEQVNRIGESRHLHKQQGTAKKYIFSYDTYAAYKNACKQFEKWLKSKYPDVKWLDQITRDMCVEYIKFREQEGKSAYTYSQDMAMIAKNLGFSLTKKECNVATRSMKNITNNRSDNGFRTKTGVVEQFIAGTGLRRNELLNLKVKNLILDEGRVVGVHVESGAKGGKQRYVQVRREYQESLYKLVEGLESDSNVISDKIPRQLQTHRIRAEYAQHMHNELVSLGRSDAKLDLTKSLGHNRKSILSHYSVK